MDNSTFKKSEHYWSAEESIWTTW